MFIVGVRRLRIAAAVLLACLALNLLIPALVSAQRALPLPSTTTATYDGPVPYSLEVSYTRGATRGEVAIEARMLIDATEHRDSYTARADTALPVDDRPGLTYLFPAVPRPRSYPYADPFASGAVPLDYVGPGNVAGVETYQYRAVVDEGDYQAERIIDLERRTGRVLDETWSTADGLFRLSEESRRAAVDTARGSVRMLRGFEVLSWLSRAVAVLTLAWLAVAVARR
ncbi:porin PorA family protein [Corynebacterium timonense]|uniref:DUF3068 domain-containing protein n=1 Tax=Corynebacterium timonense TaxID=441500 RepID=A0A1H1VB41_9CORY|nr:porin PorA family protein [Corynebacterium timonense]SDS81965.1 Protein of unknown function [Corynebacterium timonense]